MKLIKLSKNKFAKVDDIDFDRINSYKWYYSNFGYAIRDSNRTVSNRRAVSIQMHREVLGTKPQFDTDHINGDRLDNRRSNLREVSRSANLVNTLPRPSRLGIKGVYLHRNGKLVAQIGVKYRNIHLGYFDTMAAAIAARKKAEEEYYPELVEGVRS